LTLRRRPAFSSGRVLGLGGAANIERWTSSEENRPTRRTTTWAPSSCHSMT